MLHATFIRLCVPAKVARGFTLIELMITVAIVALLAAIAYPAYTDSILKGRRAEGRSALMELMQQQERFLTQNGSYMSFAGGATGATGTTQGGTNVTIPFKTTSGNTVSSAAYNLSASACPANPGPGNMALNECVLLTATPNRSDPAFGNLTFMSSGLKSCSTGNAKCWR
jgi:type IV pilus assembly protein PilE